jgi:peroxiredoxin
MQGLQDKLDQITSNTRKLVQAERLALSERATADLFATGIEDRILPVGSPAPTFSLQDASTGNMVSSSDLLALGPLVLSFFRGRWCPYCVTELESWRDLYPDLRRAGAVFAAVSPQNRRHNAFTAEHLIKHAPQLVAFPILSDPESAVAAQFGIAYTIPVSARSYYRSILVNIPFVNSGKGYDTAPDSAWRLPMPATFIIRQDGVIGFAEAHADFRIRPEPGEVMDALLTF